MGEGVDVVRETVLIVSEGVSVTRVEVGATRVEVGVTRVGVGVTRVGVDVTMGKSSLIMIMSVVEGSIDSEISAPGGTYGGVHVRVT